jgi:apolipoprotein N-acyltransferase
MEDVCTKRKTKGGLMQNLQVTLSLIGTIFGLAITVLTFLAKSIKNAKARKRMEQAITISNAVLPYICAAEQFTAFSGAEKKAYVMTKATQFALTKRIPFDEAQVSAKVDDLVEFTRKVNIRANEKEKAEIRKEMEVVSTSKSWL